MQADFKPILYLSMLGKIMCLLALLLTQANFAFGQENKIKIPALNDKYSAYVKQLEAGEVTVDYADFRNSFLESALYRQKGIKYDSLQKEVYAAVRAKNYAGVAQAAKAMLSIDYTSMFAHKYLQQTYKIIGDTATSRKYHDIEFGLLKSITRSGDGKTCATGWHVTQIEEEYFILGMLDAGLQKQSVDYGGKNACDKMVVKLENGETRTYYFEANKVFEMERKLFEK